MKKIISIIITACMLFTLTGCGKLSKPKLNEWQIELLKAEGLTTEYDELTAEQKHFIDRANEMINYLNQKYDEKFVYYGYEPAELLDSEKLYAYPKSTGIGNDKYIVTVKARNGSFEDDYHDFSVGALAEDMVNEFLLTQFEPDEFKLFHRTNSCEIKMSEIENGDFQWKYGGSFILFLKEDICNINNVENFALKYAKFFYEHRLSGSNRINILKNIPDDPQTSWGTCYKWYDDEKNYVGYCSFSLNSNPKKIIMNSYAHNENIRNRNEYSVEEYFYNIN